MQTQLIKLIWAITEVLEVDDYAIEEIANRLNVNSSDIIDLIDQAVEEYQEIKNEEVAYNDYCSSGNDDDDDDDLYFIE
ncbi:MAG: hypothetical protein CMQ41_07890 [Gammaproteobacteria bacterium]|nr:hypothetical protein [Gammaproteobacteria bacterium]|tara:strand:+ start:215 stop:451 length:237 start_codon:yes stop_codon:yes gene_type:complete